MKTMASAPRAWQRSSIATERRSRSQTFSVHEFAPGHLGGRARYPSSAAPASEPDSDVEDIPELLLLERDDLALLPHLHEQEEVAVRQGVHERQEQVSPPTE